MSKQLNQIDLKDVAYIRVLEYAANKAVGYKFTNNDGVIYNDGFTFEEICNDEKIKHIEELWLKSTLISICNIYYKGEERKRPITTDIDEEDTKLVIKSEEFMKFINLANHEITISKLRKTNIGLVIGILALLLNLFLK